MDHQRFELRFHDNCLNLFTPGRQPNAGYVRAGGERHHRDHVVLQRHVGHLSKPESPNRSRRPSTLSVLPREPGATALPSSNLHEHASREIDHRLHNAQGDSLQQPPPRLCAPQCRRNGAPSDPSRALPKKGAKKDSSVLCEGILTDYLGTVDRRPHAESWGGAGRTPSVHLHEKQTTVWQSDHDDRDEHVAGVHLVSRGRVSSEDVTE